MFFMTGAGSVLCASGKKAYNVDLEVFFFVFDQKGTKNVLKIIKKVLIMTWKCFLSAKVDQKREQKGAKRDQKGPNVDLNVFL